MMLFWPLDWYSDLQNGGGAEGRHTGAVCSVGVHVMVSDSFLLGVHGVGEKRHISQSGRRDRAGPSIEGNLRQGGGDRLTAEKGAESTSSLPKLSLALPSPTLAFLCRQTCQQTAEMPLIEIACARLSAARPAQGVNVWQLLAKKIINLDNDLYVAWYDVK